MTLFRGNKLSAFLILGLLFCSSACAVDPEAKRIQTNVSNFNKNLSSADTTVQKALDTLDDLSSLRLDQQNNPQYVINGAPIFMSGVDWRSPLFVNDAGKVLIDKEHFILKANLGGFPSDSVDWQNHLLKTGDATSVDWGAGTTKVLRTGSGYPGAYNTSVDWTNRNLCDKFGNPVLNWGQNAYFSNEELRLPIFTGSTGLLLVDSANGKVSVQTGVTVSGTVCTITAITNGVITAATCT